MLQGILNRQEMCGEMFNFLHADNYSIYCIFVRYQQLIQRGVEQDSSSLKSHVESMQFSGQLAGSGPSLER